MEFTTHLELQSQTTRLVESRNHQSNQARTGLSPSTALHSRRLDPIFKDYLASPDDISEDFTSELVPLHSPLLRESWLVSFPPPSYMLKFSGYSWLIGGSNGMKLHQTYFTEAQSVSKHTYQMCNLTSLQPPIQYTAETEILHRKWRSRVVSKVSSSRCIYNSCKRETNDRRQQIHSPTPKDSEDCGGDEQTLQQTSFPKEVQGAFKVLMTHWILQFAWRIAFRCVLHRCGSQDIHCWKCWVTFYFWGRSWTHSQRDHPDQTSKEFDCSRWLNFTHMIAGVKDRKNRRIKTYS